MVNQIINIFFYSMIQIQKYDPKQLIYERIFVPILVDVIKLL